MPQNPYMDPDRQNFSIAHKDHLGGPTQPYQITAVGDDCGNLLSLFGMIRSNNQPSLKYIWFSLNGDKKLNATYHEIVKAYDLMVELLTSTGKLEMSNVLRILKDVKIIPRSAEEIAAQKEG